MEKFTFIYLKTKFFRAIAAVLETAAMTMAALCKKCEVSAEEHAFSALTRSWLRFVLIRLARTRVGYPR